MGDGDAYLRTGRGGAGNFYSQKDVEDAVTKDKTEDIEAQKPSVTHGPDDNSTAPAATATTTTTVGETVYARSGRGGAGNITSNPPPSPLPLSLPTTSTTTSSTTTAGASTQTTTPRLRYAGRGGAGNWAGDGEGQMSGEARRAGEEQDRRRREALEAGIAREIRASLPQMPRRTYQLHGRGREGGEGDGDGRDE